MFYLHQVSGRALKPVLRNLWEAHRPAHFFDLLEDSSSMGEKGNTQTSFRGVRSSKFRHVFGSPARKGQCYECVKITKDAHDSHFCAVNPKFIAIVTETAGGGSFLVLPVEHTGRVEVSAGKVTGHKGPVLDLKWNPFNDNVIASCSDDCTVKIWYIPEEGLPRNTNLVEPLVDLRGHRRRVGYVEWHPTAENILLSAGFDHMILVWDVSHGEVVRTIDCHPDSIHSMSFNRDGSLLATTCKDKKLRIIDPRAGSVIREGVCHQGSKASKVVFLGDTGRLFTTGFSRFSDRQWAVWSQHDLSKPLRTENIDSSSGVLFPYYDHDTKMVYIAGKGDGNIRYYELVNEAPWCHYLNQFLTGCPQRGLGCMPKRGLDVRSCEVFRFYKLHATRGLCEPISMIVPRKSEQFQDDLFPDTAAPTPALTAAEWLSGKNRNPILISMKTGAGARTHKPVMYNSERNLVTADRNNERKFMFISQTNNVDYREKANHANNNNNNNNHEKNNHDSPQHNNAVNGNSGQHPHGTVIGGGGTSPLKRPQGQHFGWRHVSAPRPQQEPHQPVCDVVSSHTLPVATFVTIQDHDSSSSEPEFDGEVPQSEEELRKAFRNQSAELRRLRSQLANKEKKIQELESQLQLQAHNGGC
ncbi:coronin-2B-like isoform X2 [Dermacentor andersoni]|uniref:coronin-2B-like isoform X2 n=1 Tax=Dermacentor andersoni TaxID=34620 RepID=UPI0024170A1B|nr:coronin-2B-like isoform X2 [Dermacentor andersoni]